ncbi:DUF3592 domain-containing protein [Streptomyces sp. NPDC050844]|uniref:DUF3592 domain-containing protein n=1 Tax=Streptomyces sp. NPDC050844 TaxID=3155790 RepID=UPI0033F6536F
MGLVVFLAIGLATMGYGVYEAALHYRLRRHGIRARGLVARRESSAGTGGSGPTQHAVVEFVDDQGHMREVRDQRTGRSVLRVGGPALVIYLPGAPGTARIDDAWRSVWRIVPVLGFGCLLTGLALWELVRG